MKEYGGYIELDRYSLPMLHEGAEALNCGRNALAYLLKAKNIKKLLIPYFLCDSVPNLCKRENIEYGFYHIGLDFSPVDLELNNDEWLYVVNFYGQLTRLQIIELKQKYKRVIVDNAQAYFDMPVDETDTLYTCRKFFGVADGAFLYTDCKLENELPVDESFERMHFLLGRFERTASEFYGEYVSNNHLFADEPVKKMSKLTDNLLHAIDYKLVKERRTANFIIYENSLKELNELKLNVPEGAFAYPLLIKNGAEIRKKLQAEKIYIPTLWPFVFDVCAENDIEYHMAEDILPLPCDQRYSFEDINYIIGELVRCMKK